jgi:hypothetical protein
VRLKDVRDAYYTQSGKASDVSRQLSLAGIAIIWVFSGGGVSTGAAVHIPRDLTFAGLILVVALAADFLQYAWASGAWGIFNRIKEQTVKENADFEAPPWLNYPTLTFFWGKLVLVAAAYALLGVALASRLL